MKNEIYNKSIEKRIDNLSENLNAHIEKNRCRSVIICAYRLNKFILNNIDYFKNNAPQKLQNALHIIGIASAFVDAYFTPLGNRISKGEIINDEIKSLISEPRRTSIN